jgi:hypothetical protein
MTVPVAPERRQGGLLASAMPVAWERDLADGPEARTRHSRVLNREAPPYLRGRQPDGKLVAEKPHNPGPDRQWLSSDSRSAGQGGNQAPEAQDS